MTTVDVSITGAGPPCRLELAAPNPLPSIEIAGGDLPPQRVVAALAGQVDGALELRDLRVRGTGPWSAPPPFGLAVWGSSLPVVPGLSLTYRHVLTGSPFGRIETRWRVVHGRVRLDPSPTGSAAEVGVEQAYSSFLDYVGGRCDPVEAVAGGSLDGEWALLAGLLGLVDADAMRRRWWESTRAWLPTWAWLCRSEVAGRAVAS